MNDSERKTKMKPFIVVIFTLLLFNAYQVFALPLVSLDRVPNVVPAGTFSIDVVITDVTDLFAFQFNLGFDPNIISAMSVTEGVFLQSEGPTFFVPGFIDNTAGSIALVSDTLLGVFPGVTGTGVLASVEFTPVTEGFIGVPLNIIVILLDSKLQVIRQVPEPSTYLLFGTGFLGILVYGWRRRKPVA
jgi:PEP-CTERM motif/Cohesin domain